MIDSDPGKITSLLQEWQQGSREALEELWPKVSNPLAGISRKLLREFLRGERQGATMCTSDLVHQAFPKLTKYASREDRPWKSRVEFYALAKKVMLCVLLDYHRYAERHGNRGGEELSDNESWAPERDGPCAEDLIDLDKHMELLRQIDPNGYQIIRLRFYEDHTIAEIIQMMGWTEYKVYLHLKGALGFLHSKMKARGPDSGC